MKAFRDIEPGTETWADRLNTVRALALMAAAGREEADALKTRRLEGGRDTWAIEIDAAEERAMAAEMALAEEVEALERNGNMLDLVDLAALAAGGRA